MGRDQAALINMPERFTQFLLEPDEKKVTWELDTRKLFHTLCPTASATC
jgi:predicted GNAT superfamily acetyltransferase